MGSCQQKDSVETPKHVKNQENIEAERNQLEKEKYFVSKPKLASHQSRMNNITLSDIPQQPTSIPDFQSPTDLRIQEVDFDQLGDDKPLQQHTSMADLLLTQSQPTQEKIRPQSQKLNIRFQSSASYNQSILKKKELRPKSVEKKLLKRGAKAGILKRPRNKSSYSSQSNQSKTVRFSHTTFIQYFRD